MQEIWFEVLRSAACLKHTDLQNRTHPHTENQKGSYLVTQALPLTY
jgi:hypothetical protein